MVLLRETRKVMKTIYLASSVALILALGVTACTMQAQQQTMPDMPGMKMSPQPTQPQQMSNAPQPNRTKEPPVPVPGDLKNMQQDNGNVRAKAAATSIQDSIEQQRNQGDKKPGANSDAGSIKVPFQSVQEPEAIEFRTGTDLPAVELLHDVINQSPMTVEDFIGLAEKNNPTLVQAQRNIERSNQQARQLGLPPDPIVGYSGDHIRGGEYHGGEQGAFFSQVFVLGRKLALRRDVYRAQGRANQFALEVQRARIHDDVGRSFFHTLAMQESVVIHDRLLKVAMDSETNAHELERIGEADAADVLGAEIAAEQAKVDFNQAQRLFLASFAQLSTYAGQKDLPAHPLAGGLVEPPQLDAEAMVGRDVEESPYVKTAQSKVGVAEDRMKDARRERFPNLNVTAGEWFSGEPVNSGAKAGFESFIQAGVQLPLWNRNQGNTQAAKALVDRAHLDVARTQLWTRNQAEPYAQEYLTSRATAERYRTAMLPRARRAYQLEVTKYQQMALAYPHVLTAQHMLFTLQLSYVQALDREWGAAIALQNYTLMNGLDAPMDAGDDSTMMNLPTGGNQ
jgi:cobalt-zinc-cadmium efflux system outer membrane protein